MDRRQREPFEEFQEEQHRIVISQREVYDRLLQVRDDVRDVKSELRDLRGYADEIRGTVKDLKEQNLKDFNKRIKGLELRFYGVLAGLLAGLLALLRATGSL